MFWLLVACGTEIGGGGEAEPDVDVAPRQIVATFDNETMDCRSSAQEDRSLYEWIDSTVVVNFMDEPVTVEVQPTHTIDDVEAPEQESGSWMDVSVPEPFYVEVAPGAEEAVGLYAMGRCHGTDAFDRFGTYVYPVTLSINWEHVEVTGQIVLTPDNSDYK